MTEQPRRTTRTTIRRRVAVATVLVCLPYLGLKVAWALGATIGVRSDTFADATRGANLLTAGLEIIAILLALAFVHPSARRLPPFVVAFPTWVATGLLTPVALGFLLGAPLQILTGGGNPLADDVLAGWVFVLVYGGFVLEAVLLLLGFVLYARDRWPVVTGGGRPREGWGGTRPLQNLLLGVGTVAALAFAAQQASWAIAGGGSFSDPETAQRVLLATTGALAAAGGLAMLRLVRGARLSRRVLAMTWCGSAVVFASALSEMLKVVAIPAWRWGAVAPDPAEATLTLFILLGALAAAIGGALRLVEEERPVEAI